MYDNSVKRTNHRKNYQRDVCFSAGAMVFPGMVRNISPRGACIGSRDASKIGKGSEIIVAIPFVKKPGSMKRKAVVRWVRDDQFGIQFI